MCSKVLCLHRQSCVTAQSLHMHNSHIFGPVNVCALFETLGHTRCFFAFYALINSNELFIVGCQTTAAEYKLNRLLKFIE